MNASVPMLWTTPCECSESTLTSGGRYPGIGPSKHSEQKRTRRLKMDTRTLSEVAVEVEELEIEEIEEIVAPGAALAG